MSRTPDFKRHANFYMTAVCGSVRSHSLPDFNRSRNSIAFSKHFRVNRQRNIGPQRYVTAGQGGFSEPTKKTPEEMRSNLFLFLRILPIRVGFDANSTHLR